MVRAAVPGLVAKSEKMKALASLLPRVATSSAPVVIEGETGAGKGYVATALHALSNRRARPFDVLSCGSIPESLADSELFGHARGAFTHAFEAQAGRIERANGGTLVLDHVEDLPASIQPKLLRALEEEKIQRLGETMERRVDVRFFATCKGSLKGAVSRGELRDDLYHRLSVITLDVPPLRERVADIVPLAETFLTQEREAGRTKATGFSKKAAEVLERYPWPGNVRELYGAVVRATLQHQGEGEIDASHLSSELMSERSAVPQIARDGVALPKLIDVERSYIALVLEYAKGSKTDAARILGISRKSLWERSKRLTVH